MNHIIELANKLEYNEYFNLCTILQSNLNKKKKENMIKYNSGILNTIIIDYNYKINDDLNVCDGGNIEIILSIVFTKVLEEISSLRLEITVGAEGEFYVTNNDSGYEFRKKYTKLKLDDVNIKNYNDIQLKNVLSKILMANNFEVSYDNIEQFMLFIVELFKDILTDQSYFDFRDIECHILPGYNTKTKENVLPKKIHNYIDKNKLIYDLKMDTSFVCEKCLINELREKHFNSVNNNGNSEDDEYGSYDSDVDFNCYYNYKTDEIECCYETDYEWWINDILHP